MHMGGGGKEKKKTSLSKKIEKCHKRGGTQLKGGGGCWEKLYKEKGVI